MKKYNLKPGKHQFAPGSHAVHENDNISDEEAEWYLQKYPHIASLFEQISVPEKEKEPITELQEMEFPFVRKSKSNQ